MKGGGAEKGLNSGGGSGGKGGGQEKGVKAGGVSDMKIGWYYREVVLGMSDAALWQIGVAPQQWPVIFRKK